MLRTCIAIAAFSAPLLGQDLAPHAPRPINAPVREAGVFHLGTGSWTRKVQSAALGLQVVYNNTCPSSYYSALSTAVVSFQDDGRLPSPTSPTSTISRPGCATSYVIDGFELGYCTDEPGVALHIQFFDDLLSCVPPTGLTPTAGFVLANLPTTSLFGTSQCWTVMIDLDSPPMSSSLAFVMRADADGSYAVPGHNTFGWTFGTGSGVHAGYTGPLLAGGPLTCSYWDGTVWDTPYVPTEPGTGMGNIDSFRINTASGGYPAGCHFFGGYPTGAPFAGFHLRLFADACPSSTPATEFCFGDGSGTDCPCSNNAPASERGGCLHSLGASAKLRASGVASLASDTLVLTGSDMPPTASALYFQGSAALANGAGAVFGDGLRCAGGSVMRLGAQVSSGGASQFPGPGDAAISIQGAAVPFATRFYQVWYRNIAAFCTPAGFNLTNALQVTWGT